MREAREDRTREDASASRASPPRAHFDFPPFLRLATQASNLALFSREIHKCLLKHSEIYMSETRPI